jgi:electron transfer flavoprotein beta subunit
MRIVVILGRVLDPGGIVVKRKAGRIFVNREEYMLQPADVCALEAALRIKDAGAAEVITLPRSLLPDDDVLRQALAMGADRAIYLVRRIANPSYDNGQIDSPSYDDAAMARVLAAAVERLDDVDLILTGATMLDTGQGQLGPRLAEALGWPQIVEAWQAEVVNGKVQAPKPSPPEGGG